MDWRFNMDKKILSSKTLVKIVFITFIISAIYVIVKMALSPVTVPDNQQYIHVKGYYVIMLVQCILGAIAMLLPGILKKHLHLYIPSKMVIVYAIFLYCAIYLGEVHSFYYRVPKWDSILHAFSSAMLGAIGFSFITILNKADSVPMNISPIFVAVFTFCFGISLGVVWEIYEFSVDAILNTNMQKYALENGVLLIGRAALTDTMKDLIVDCAGAFIMSIIGYCSLKYKMGWLEKLQLRYNKELK
jgi:hypothetical protein